jgi:hypothetical protein
MKLSPERNSVIMDPEEVEELHLWLEDYLGSLIFYYEDKKLPEKQKLALEVRRKFVWEFVDNLLFLKTQMEGEKNV